MAKELPYWKFVVLDYVSGDISLERWELQGIFYSVCAFYWSKNCEVSLTLLYKKYKGSDEKLIIELFELGILKTEENELKISFLNEQWNSKETQKMVNAINGRKGGRPPKNPTVLNNKPEHTGIHNQQETDLVTENPNKSNEKPNGFIFASEIKANHNPNITNIEYSKGKESKVKESKEETPSFDFVISEEDEENLQPYEDLSLSFEITETVKDICKFFNMGEEKFFYKEQREVSIFVNLLVYDETYEHFKTQWENYKAYKHLSGNPHSLFGFIGKKVPGKNEFEGQKWNSANWGAMLADYTTNKPGKKQTITQAIEQATNLDNPFDPNAPAPTI